MISITYSWHGNRLVLPSRGGEAPMQGSAPLVAMRAITKRFGGVVPLDGVDLDAHAGEVLAIVGADAAHPAARLERV
jgi:hypothetical protein